MHEWAASRLGGPGPESGWGWG